MYRVLSIAVLGVSLAACSSPAPTASASAPVSRPASVQPAASTEPAAASKPAANAVDPAVIQALNKMGTYLSTLKRFSVDIDLDGERVLADGQKLQHTATARIDIDRPNKMRAQMRSARAQRDLIYDGKTVTLYQPAQKYYASAGATENLGDLIVHLRQRFGIEVPIGDLFLWGTPAAPVDNITSAMYAGSDYIDGTLCDHYALRQGAVDWQIWIASGNRPVPRKVVMTSRADEARPQSVTWLDWKLKPAFKDSVFHFTPPQGAREAKFVPLKTQ
ncbi:conserved exported hypothetical protein [Cupriavidus necator]|uniref:DUF2092 domain-containing protein n=1 Tax=Cupriavidus necator TaxID=106590 RepID=A0A1K0J1G3_CUPNE|nr:conserved exported hypothetical protein [Cupriavidus necator]